MTDKVRRRENIFNDQRKLKLRKKNRTIKDYRFIVIQNSKKNIEVKFFFSLPLINEFLKK